jgi:hypothetical protein
MAAPAPSNFTPSLKVGTIKTGLTYTTTRSGKKIVCIEPRQLETVKKLIKQSTNPDEIGIKILGNKNAFFSEISRKIIKISNKINEEDAKTDDDILTILKQDYEYFQQAKYNYRPIYTWIIKPESPIDIENITMETPLKMYMKRVISKQEIGSLHSTIQKTHPTNNSNQSEKVLPVGAGELRLETPTHVVCNLLSGTYMFEKILKGKTEKEKEIIENKLRELVMSLLEKNGITTEFTDADFIAAINMNKYVCSSQNEEEFISPFYKNISFTTTSSNASSNASSSASSIASSNKPRMSGKRKAKNISNISKVEKKPSSKNPKYTGGKLNKKYTYKKSKNRK